MVGHEVPEHREPVGTPPPRPFVTHPVAPAVPAAGGGPSGPGDGSHACANPCAHCGELTGAALDADVVRAVLSNTTALVCILDAGGRLELFNRACEQLTGFAAAEVLGRGVWEALVVADERALARSDIEVMAAGPTGAVAEGTWRDRWGGTHLIAWHNTPLPDRDGRPHRMVCVGVDITEQRRAELRLHEVASTDALTGSLNRRAMFDELRAALDPGRDGCGLLYCDLDGFKRVNDELGHASGDRLLSEVAHRVRGVLRPGDLLARPGGDEFVVLRPGAGPGALPELRELAALVRRVVGEPYALPGGTGRVGVSVGVHVAVPGEGPDEALGAADRRMYGAKREARPERVRTGR
ncbi:diguanylate cyclase domain-containing protein [Kineococcus sp. G2]|uniref:diguanylate cyclase domain-containing protein n=1 Tax=Kineococcus sp. G2 TaxID=3127484 RepID=UPI00301D3E7E